jgi:hypothetical protein
MLPISIYMVIMYDKQFLFKRLKLHKLVKIKL